MRSRLEMDDERTFRRVVLPAPVPPEINMFNRAFTHPDKSSSIGGRKRAVVQQILGNQRILAESSDGKTGAIHSQWRDYGIHARAIGQSRVHHR